MNIKLKEKETMKKRLFLILLVVLVFVVACQKEDVANDGTIDNNYVNEMYGYILELPEEWKGKKDKIKVFEGNYGRSTTFAYPFTHDLVESDGNIVYQDFFTISVASKAEYERILSDPPVLSTFIAENDEKVYLLYMPIDNIIMGEENHQEYNDLRLSEDKIIDIFSLNK